MPEWILTARDKTFATGKRCNARLAGYSNAIKPRKKIELSHEYCVPTRCVSVWRLRIDA